MKDKLQIELMGQVQDVAAAIRKMEDLAVRYSINIDNDNLYIALKAHHYTLSDILKNIRRR